MSLQVESGAMHRCRKNIAAGLLSRELGLQWRQQHIPANTALQNYAESVASQSSQNEVCPRYSLTATFCDVVVVVVAYAFKSHNWSARQRHHRLQSSLDNKPNAHSSAHAWVKGHGSLVM